MIYTFLQLIFLIAVLYFVFWQLDLLRFGSSPFVSSPTRILPDVANLLNLSRDSVLYDLGCGDARVLAYCAKLVPEAKFVGVDGSFFALVSARLWLFRHGLQGKVKLLRKNYFDVNLADATHVYLWLSRPSMDELYPKLKKELRAGAKVVSCDFPFTAVPPTKTIDLGSKGKAFGHTLYVYDF